MVNTLEKIMQNLICFFLCATLVFETIGIMIKKECPVDEIHKSCSFIEEYVCWLSEDRSVRIKSPPKRLNHCSSGCFCKKGYVREYTGGGCIVAAACRDQQARAMLDKLPIDKGLFLMSGDGRGV